MGRRELVMDRGDCLAGREAMPPRGAQGLVRRKLGR